MTGTAEGLANAWLKRLNDLNVQLAHIDHAPALFKPDYVEQVKQDYDKALYWVQFWGGQ